MSHQAARKLYELRYYHLAAQDVVRMRNLVQEIFRVRVRHSRVVGFWATELGALNHVFHIWEYDSQICTLSRGTQASQSESQKSLYPSFRFADMYIVKGYAGQPIKVAEISLPIFSDSLTARKAKRDALAGDQEWANKFLKQALPAFKLQENCVTKAILGDMQPVWSDKEFYKVLTVNYQGVSQDEARQKFLNSAKLLQGQHQSAVIKGAFETVIGKSREFNILQSASNLDDLLGRDEAFTSDPSATTYSKVLYPYQWTKWLHD